MRNKAARDQHVISRKKERDIFHALEGRRCAPVTGNVALEEGDDSTIIEGIVDKVISCARVPAPKWYSFPRHLIVDEPVKALK